MLANKRWIVAAAFGLASLTVAGPAPQAQAAEGAKLPAPVRIVLPNGLTLLVVQRSNLPLVSLSAVVRAGSAQDPAGKWGLAGVTNGLLKRGTTSMTAPQLAEAIDAVGGSLSTETGVDASSVGVNVLTKDVKLGVSLLADMLQRPAFAPAELARQKEEDTGALKQSLDDANTVVRLAARERVMAGTPYEHVGTLSGLKALGASDVRKFYNTYYRPNNTIISVVGDMTLEAARAQLGSAFAGWRQGVVPQRAPVNPAPIKGRHVVLVDMDVTQSFVMLGHPAMRRNNPDYYALTVLNFILGGDFTSRLNQSIRDRQGLAYGAGSAFRTYLEAGYFVASLNTRAEQTAKALESLVSEIKGIQDAPVTPQELDTAKAYLMGSFPLRFETNKDVATEVADIDLYGWPADFLTTYRDRIAAVSAQDVLRVARTYLQPNDYDLVVVTKAGDVGKALAPYGTVEAVAKERLIQ